MSCILVIDIGTSSMRGVLYNEQGKRLNKIQIRYSPEFLADNRVEQDPLIFRRALQEITSEAVKWSEQEGLVIEAVSVTSQRSSIIPVDHAGNAIRNAIMWQDKRAFGICEELDAHSEFVYKLSGSRINPVFAAPKITWLRRNEPEIYNQADKIVVIPDYLIYQMTNRYVTDYTYGSRTSLMNIKTMQWDDELLERFEVDKDKLCELVLQGSIVGYTSEAFKQSTGLPSGTPVISAGGDQQCAALGSGVIENGAFQVTTGTGSFILASSARLHLDPQMRMICNVSAVQGQYVLESSILTTATVCNWFSANFYDDLDASSALERMLEDAAASPEGSNGICKTMSIILCVH